MVSTAGERRSKARNRNEKANVKSVRRQKLEIKEDKNKQKKRGEVWTIGKKKGWVERKMEVVLKSVLHKIFSQNNWVMEAWDWGFHAWHMKPTGSWAVKDTAKEKGGKGKCFTCNLGALLARTSRRKQRDDLCLFPHHHIHHSDVVVDEL